MLHYALPELELSSQSDPFQMIRYAISSGWFRPGTQRTKRENPVITTSGYIGSPYNTSVTSDERYLSTAVTSIIPSPFELICQGLGTEKIAKLS